MPDQHVYFKIEAFCFDEKYHLCFMVHLYPSGELHQCWLFNFEDLNYATWFLRGGVSDFVELGLRITTINGEQHSDPNSRIQHLEIPCVVELVSF